MIYGSPEKYEIPWKILVDLIERVIVHPGDLVADFEDEGPRVILDQIRKDDARAIDLLTKVTIEKGEIADQASITKRLLQVRSEIRQLEAIERILVTFRKR